jgi:hypothetical protein
MDLLHDDNGVPNNSWRPPGNILNAFILAVVIMTLSVAVFTTFYRAPMRRREAEQLYRLHEHAIFLNDSTTEELPQPSNVSSKCWGKDPPPPLYLLL